MTPECTCCVGDDFAGSHEPYCARMGGRDMTDDDWAAYHAELDQAEQLASMEVSQ